MGTKSKECFFTVIVESFFKVALASTLNEDICFGQNLNNLHRKNIGGIILAHININFIRYKFEQLVYGFKGKVDVPTTTETKLGDSFQTMQFSIGGNYTFRLYRSEYGGGILLLYV